MPELMAVYGPTAPTIHLYLDGYQPGAKSRRHRSPYEVAMCGVGVHLRSGIGYSHEKATGRVMVPFATALEYERAPITAHPLPILPLRRFCAKCLGLAVAHYGLTDDTLKALDFKIRSNPA